jgi:hypothetical protein
MELASFENDTLDLGLGHGEHDFAAAQWADRLVLTTAVYSPTLHEFSLPHLGWAEEQEEGAEPGVA